MWSLPEAATEVHSWVELYINLGPQTKQVNRYHGKGLSAKLFAF